MGFWLMRYSNNEEWLEAVEAAAQRYWEHREQLMWGDDPQWAKFRQTWEQGTDLAKDRVRSEMRGVLLETGRSHWLQK